MTEDQARDRIRGEIVRAFGWCASPTWGLDEVVNWPALHDCLTNILLTRLDECGVLLSVDDVAICWRTGERRFIEARHAMLAGASTGSWVALANVVYGDPGIYALRAE